MDRTPAALVDDRALADGIHSLSMEGLRPSAKGLEVARACARGEITLEEAEAALDEHFGRVARSWKSRPE